MKNNILTFLLGIFVTISIAATIPNTGLFTVKPATPKSIIVFTGRGYDIANFIKINSSKGYVVKHFSTLTGVNGIPGDLVIMEKY